MNELMAEIEYTHCDTKISITVGQNDLEQILRRHFREVIPEGSVITSVEILVKSKNNYRAEWEPASLKLSVTGNLKS